MGGIMRNEASIRRRRKYVTRILAVLALSFSLIGAPLADGSASASELSSSEFSCKSWNTIAVMDYVPIDTSWICGHIGQGDPPYGSGFFDLREKGWFNTFGYRFRMYPALCNYWVDFDVYSADGVWYYHSQGQQVDGCASILFDTTATRALNADYILQPNSDICLTVWRHSMDQIKQVVRTCGVAS
jgi:hypothetical protein